MGIDRYAPDPARRHASIERRDFLKTAAAAAAGGALSPSLLSAHAPAVDGRAVRRVQEQLAALGNGEAPALQFQAYPGGTGALMERLWKEHDGNPFARTPIDLEPWSGPVPTREEELAFLPAHRLG